MGVIEGILSVWITEAICGWLNLLRPSVLNEELKFLAEILI